MKYSVLTFGCRVNQADSLRVEEDLRARGCEAASGPDAADLVIVNTCSVTATADQGARQVIRRVARANPAARIVVTGCYATRQPGEAGSLPGVIRLVPNDRKDTLVVDLAADITLGTADRFGNGDGPCGAAIAPGVAGRTAFTLRVQTGCEQACSYCIIPTTRGRGRSLPVDEVCREVTRVAAAGFKEIELTGVHLGSYGRDLPRPTSLIALLRALDSLDADVRFRISSLEPMDCPRELVDLVAAGGPFEPHFHLPLQHASDRMLRAMSRPYTLGDYRALVDDIRARLPDASIGSDVIVGFPGETRADVAALEAYLSGSPLTHVHVFPYSDRPGTAASTMTDKVPGMEVRARGQAVRAIASALTRRFRASQLGTVRPGLTLEDGSLVVTDNYLKLRIPPGLTRNQRVRVRVVSADEPMTGILA